MPFFRNLGRSLGLSYGDPNPANSAQPYLNQIPSTVRPILDPYISEGRTADNNARNAFSRAEGLYTNSLPQYGEMANNPVEFLNQLQRSYTPSEGYNYRKNQLLSSMRNTAAAGGYSGNTFDQNQQAEALNGILGQDQQQNLQNLLGILNGGLGGQERMLGGRERALHGLAGLEQGIGQRGFNAAQELAGMLGQNLTNQSQYAFQGQRQENVGRNRVRGNRLNFINQALGFINPGNFMG